MHTFEHHPKTGPEGYTYGVLDEEGTIWAWVKSEEEAEGVIMLTNLTDALGQEIDRLRKLLKDAGIEPGGPGGWEEGKPGEEAGNGFGLTGKSEF
jgi:hypothetical protein